jgi:carboxypeptidase C (cathepsin A)
LIGSFVTRTNRWPPKYLIGESYGTTEFLVLALELQENNGCTFNDVILVSPTTLGIDQQSPLTLKLPYFAATAWYHKMLPADLQSKDLTDIPEVEEFTDERTLPLSAKGGALRKERKEIAVSNGATSGMSEKCFTK